MPAPLWLGGALAGIGSAFSGGLGFLGQSSANKQNRALARDQMAFQERMSSTAYQRAVRDMEKAGLNPMLAYQQGGASSPQGSLPVMKNELEAASNSAANLAQNVLAGFKLATENQILQENFKVAEYEGTLADAKAIPARRALQVAQEADKKIDEIFGGGNDGTSKNVPKQSNSANTEAERGRSHDLLRTMLEPDTPTNSAKTVPVESGKRLKPIDWDVMTPKERREWMLGDWKPGIGVTKPGDSDAQAIRDAKQKLRRLLIKGYAQRRSNR